MGEVYVLLTYKSSLYILPKAYLRKKKQAANMSDREETIDVDMTIGEEVIIKQENIEEDEIIDDDPVSSTIHTGTSDHTFSNRPYKRPESSMCEATYLGVVWRIIPDY
ncbi:hypothetical protein GE061_018409 [Apolygus lucorum]|uniref:Uncharacterized protein n=1 Tax=Apolygus lucorum TaxID=248454 RepID=A0A8S9XDP2_APOLU|nr:hypothetical protein GE061_018409 [Apolygus lucorum]